MHHRRVHSVVWVSAENDVSSVNFSLLLLLSGLHYNTNSHHRTELDDNQQNEEKRSEEHHFHASIQTWPSISKALNKTTFTPEPIFQTITRFLNIPCHQLSLSTHLHQCNLIITTHLTLWRIFHSTYHNLHIFHRLANVKYQSGTKILGMSKLIKITFELTNPWSQKYWLGKRLDHRQAYQKRHGSCHRSRKQLRVNWVIDFCT